MMSKQVSLQKNRLTCVCLLMVCALVGCGSDDAASSQELILGTWERMDRDSGNYMTFYEDGNFGMECYSDRWGISSTPDIEISGTWVLSDEKITFTVVETFDEAHRDLVGKSFTDAIAAISPSGLTLREESTSGIELIWTRYE